MNKIEKQNLRDKINEDTHTLVMQLIDQVKELTELVIELKPDDVENKIKRLKTVLKGKK